MNSYAIISLFGAVQGVFFAFSLLAIKRYAYEANRYFAALVFVLSLTLIYAFLHHSKLILEIPELFGVSPFLPFLYGPVLFIYIRSFLESDYSLRTYDWLHLIPLIVFLALRPYYLFLSTEHKKIYLMNIFADQFTFSMDSMSIARISLLALYIGASLYLVFKDRNLNREQYNWLMKLLITSIVIWAVYFIFNVYNLNILNIVLPTLITLSFFLILYQAIKYPQTFQNVELKKLIGKYESSGLSDERRKEGIDRLKGLMESDHIYNKIDLNIQYLAKHIGFSVKHLSQIINEDFKQSFIDFVNQYRVEAAKKKLLDNQYDHLKIMAIANEVGFNSKSTFNAVFKKSTGLTPSQFKEKSIKN